MVLDAPEFHEIAGDYPGFDPRLDPSAHQRGSTWSSGAEFAKACCTWPEVGLCTMTLASYFLVCWWSLSGACRRWGSP